MDQRLSGLTSAILTARTERIAKEAVLSQIRALPASQITSLPVLAGNPSISALRAQMIGLQQEQARLGETLDRLIDALVSADAGASGED